jgi:hypothetical protein
MRQELPFLFHWLNWLRQFSNFGGRQLHHNPTGKLVCLLVHEPVVLTGLQRRSHKRLHRRSIGGVSTHLIFVPKLNDSSEMHL